MQPLLQLGYGGFSVLLQAGRRLLLLLEEPTQLVTLAFQGLCSHTALVGVRELRLGGSLTRQGKARHFNGEHDSEHACEVMSLNITHQPLFILRTHAAGV